MYKLTSTSSSRFLKRKIQICVLHVKQVSHTTPIVRIHPRTASEMLVCQFGHLTTSWSTLDETFLDEERLVDLLKGTCVLAYGGGNGRDSYGSTLELVDDGEQNLVVNLIETELVDIEGLKRYTCYAQSIVPSPLTCAKSRTRRSRRWLYVEYLANVRQSRLRHQTHTAHPAAGPNAG